MTLETAQIEYPPDLPNLNDVPIVGALDLVLTGAIAFYVMRHLWASHTRSQTADDKLLQQLIESQLEVNRKLLNTLLELKIRGVHHD